MTPLLSQIQADLVVAMKAHDSLRANVLKMLKAAVMNWEIAQNKTAEDGDVLSLIGTQLKQRKDAAEQYRAGGRPELAEKEDAEGVLLQGYLPAQLTEAEIAALITEAIASTGATTAKDLGKVMGVLSPQTKGKADGALVSRLVRESLGTA